MEFFFKKEGFFYKANTYDLKFIYYKDICHIYKSLSSYISIVLTYKDNYPICKFEEKLYNDIVENWMRYHESKLETKLETKLDKLLEHIEIIPGGSEYGEAEKRFTENS